MVTIAAIVAFVAAGGALAMAWRVGALSAFSESSTDTATTAPAASGAGKRSVTAVNEGSPQVLPTTSKSGSVDPVGRVVDALRRRRWARIGLSAVSVGLMIGGLAMVGYPVYTNFYADRKQAELERQLASPELEEAYRRGTVEEGDSLTRIIIPALDVDVVVVEGVGASALRAGAGHYPKTALPCEVGNVAIAGHRTTYGRPFHNLDLLDPGDTIILKTPIGSCTYEVAREGFIVTPKDTSVVDDTPGEASLTLTTCHPKGSARQRLIIRAERIGNEVSDA